ncbi:MAG: helix-turn-helix domain-containing protein [Rhodocyclaceae bacterium]|nr:helix-turn-helix domain-containing protein [Rhodocyclaceae bacterium]
MYDMFKCAGRDWSLITGEGTAQSLMAPVVVSEHGTPMTVGNDVRIVPDHAFADCPPVALVCVPELAVPPGEPIEGRFDATVRWLAQCHRQGAILATACSGALLLGEAGLLGGQDATTHWAYCGILAERYPTARVHPQRALVVSGEGQRLVMAGGGTTWLDLALYLIARLVGVEEAMQVARMNLIDWHAIGQQPFARLARTRQSEDALIADCQVWIADNYRCPSPVAAMAGRSGLPERSFNRRFQAATGLSPMEYVLTLRLEEAKQMLEAGDEPVEGIALAVGYEDAGFFSRLFRRKVGLTPAQYRKRFGALRRALAAA